MILEHVNIGDPPEQHLSRKRDNSQFSSSHMARFRDLCAHSGLSVIIMIIGEIVLCFLS